MCLEWGQDVSERPTSLCICSFSSVRSQLDRLPVRELAAELHASWAADRGNKGWKYGPALDEKVKTHPGLIPFAVSTHGHTTLCVGDDYNRCDVVASVAHAPVMSISLQDLAPSSQQYDIGISSLTLASILELGYAINKENAAGLGASGLGKELAQLVEYLAENAHESWASDKIRDGWRHGPVTGCMTHTLPSVTRSAWPVCRCIPLRHAYHISYTCFQVRNDIMRTHPNLLPYCDMEETEKGESSITVLSCHVMSCRVVLRLCRVVSPHVVSCHVMSCHVM